MSINEQQTRRFGSIGEAARNLTRVARVSPELWRCYRGGISPSVREQVMVAVSQANSCRGCSQAHRRWALRTGVSESELKGLGLEDLTGLRPEARAAVIYAVERAEAGFRGPVGGTEDPEITAVMDQHFTRDETAQIEAVARGISFVNLSVGTAEALRKRLTG